MRNTMAQKMAFSEEHTGHVTQYPHPDNIGVPGRNKRVYMDFYGFDETPFAITPDPEFLFLSATHQVAIDKILYGINGKMGFMLLTGEVGTGKTTVCRAILDRLNHVAETVYIINPSLSGKEIVSGILDDLGISYPSSSTRKDLIHRLNSFLLNENMNSNVVVIIDDTQTMSMEALEDLRLLSNLETDKDKLLQVVLVGQPELLGLLSGEALRQLKQRIAINCRLDFLKEEEMEGYITRRLYIAGDNGRVRFTGKAVRKIYKYTNGVPRLINKVCDLALTAGYVSNDFIIQPEHIQRAVTELGDFDAAFGNPNPRKRRGYRMRLLTYGVFLFAACLLLLSGNNHIKHLSKVGQADIRSYFLMPLSSGGHYIKDKLSWMFPEKESRPPVVISRSISGSGEKPPAPESPEIMEEKKNAINSPPYQYALQLGSYRTRENLSEAYEEFRQKGLFIHWQKHDQGESGIWYRLLTKRFPSKEAAEQFRSENGLTDAAVAYAPWTLLIDECVLKKDLQRIRKKLHAYDFDTYYVEVEDDQYKLFSGFFPNYKKAGLASQQLTRLGIPSKVVRD